MQIKDLDKRHEDVIITLSGDKKKKSLTRMRPIRQHNESAAPTQRSE